GAARSLSRGNFGGAHLPADRQVSPQEPPGTRRESTEHAQRDPAAVTPRAARKPRAGVDSDGQPIGHGMDHPHPTHLGGGSSRPFRPTSDRGGQGSSRPEPDQSLRGAPRTGGGG